MKTINYLLTYVPIACVIFLLAFSAATGYYIISEATPDICFYSGGVITLFSIIVLLFLLWIKKDLLPEELKEEDRKRQDARKIAERAEEADKRAKEHELKMINLLKINGENNEAQAYKEKYNRLNRLLENFKEEINKEINQSNEAQTNHTNTSR